MRVLVDYRSALRDRSGVGEYAHQIVRALLAVGSADAACPIDLSVFSSSLKDRLRPTAELAGASALDHRLPGQVLNFAWHRLEWPPVETLTGGTFDVTHSLHPLMMPARHAARVITIHDLDFLVHPERTRAEIRRDYPVLAGAHARRADAIVVISNSTGREVERQFGVAADRIAVAFPGAPPWEPRSTTPDRGYILFMGTLEPRKNLGGLLDAYEQLLARRPDVPRLVLAGKALQESTPWLERMAKAPLAGRVEHIGYVQSADRRGVYEGAALLVQPSFDEGFGMPVLEAMTLGVPVVAANRGALPEVLGDAGPLVEPEDADGLAGAIERMIDDPAYAAACAQKGVLRARRFTWEAAARAIYGAYRMAVERRCASA